MNYLPFISEKTIKALRRKAKAIHRENECITHTAALEEMSIGLGFQSWNHLLKQKNCVILSFRTQVDDESKQILKNYGFELIKPETGVHEFMFEQQNVYPNFKEGFKHTYLRKTRWAYICTSIKNFSDVNSIKTDFCGSLSIKPEEILFNGVHHYVEEDDDDFFFEEFGNYGD